MSQRNLKYLNTNRIVYRRLPLTDKPTQETDKYMFYEQWHKKSFDTWKRGLWYNYNFDPRPHHKQEDKRGCIFNTSHLKLYPNDVQAKELHEATDWAIELWESYGRL